jgi:succinate dehydrogenase / fumarate reductase iron-sulfur subunit
MVRGQTDPSAVGQLLESAGTAINTIKKVGPRKVLMHPKLPDQKQVRRVFQEIESKDERLELNLYIVGEEGGEE